MTFVASYNMAFLGLTLKMVMGVKAVFDDNQTMTLYRLSGKTLAEAKLKNSDARWRVMELLRHYPYTRAEICAGAGCGSSVVKTMIDAGVLEPFTVEKKKSFQLPDAEHQKVSLTAEQAEAAARLVAKIGGGFSVTLLDGVTGSGKTEVYFEAVAKALENGRQVLIMVPEISLTTQWLNRFENVSVSVPPAGIRDWDSASAWTTGARSSTAAPKWWSVRVRLCFCPLLILA